MADCGEADRLRAACHERVATWIAFGGLDPANSDLRHTGRAKRAVDIAKQELLDHLEAHGCGSEQ